MAVTAADVQRAFQNALGRAPSQDDINAYVAASNSGALTDLQIYQTISNSQEANLISDPVVRFYQAAFGRVPDADGLDNAQDYVRAFTPSAQTYITLANEFSESQEFTNRFGAGQASDPVTAAYIQSLYSTILGRQASAAEIADYTSNANGYGTRGGALYAISQSQEAISISDNAVNGFLLNAAEGDAVYTGTLYTPANGGSGAPGTGGQFFTLTPFVDAPGSTGPGINTLGTAGNDTYIGDDSTYNAGDLIDGAGGIDTLTLFFENGGDASVRTSNVEIIDVTFPGSQGDDVNLLNADGVTEIVARDTDAGFNFTNVQNNVNIVLDSIDNATIGVEFDAGALGSNDATVTVEVNNAGSVSGGPSAIQIDTNGETVTTLTVAAEGSNVLLVDEVDDNELDLETLTITGAGQLVISDVGAGEFANLTTVDASETTGGVSVDLGFYDANQGDINEQDVDVTLGSGNDVVTFAEGQFDDGDSVDGGGGNADTLNISAEDVGNTDAAQNFEVLALYGDNTDVDPVEISGNDFSTVALQNDLANDLELEDFDDGNLIVVEDQTGTITFDDTDAVTVTVSQGLEISDVVGASLTLVNGSADNDADVILTNLDLSGVSEATFSVADEDSSLEFTALTLDDTESLTFTGAGDVEVNGLTDAADDLETLDLSELTGVFTNEGSELSAGGIEILVGNLEDGSYIELDSTFAASDTLTFGPTLAGDISVDNFEFGVGGDTLDLGALGFDSFADVNAATTEVGGEAVIDTGAGSITLVGVALQDLDAANFAF